MQSMVVRYETASVGTRRIVDVCVVQIFCHLSLTFGQLLDLTSASPIRAIECLIDFKSALALTYDDG